MKKQREERRAGRFPFSRWIAGICLIAYLVCMAEMQGELTVQTLVKGAVISVMMGYAYWLVIPFIIIVFLRLVAW